jgi:hypothetical protein
MLNDSAVCECGHTFDEHSETWDCTVADCQCAYFDENPDADADAEKGEG